MSDIAVEVENLSKQYRLGEYTGVTMLREALMNGIAGIVRRGKRKQDAASVSA